MRGVKMYDSHIGSGKYRGFKETLIAILNGDAPDVSLEKIEAKIDEAFEDNQLQATQYDDLMRLVDEIKMV